MKRKKEPEPDQFFQFHCLQNKKNHRFYNCETVSSKNPIKIINAETKEIENYQTPIQMLAYEAEKDERTKKGSVEKSAITTSSIITASLYGSFGLAIAYYLMSVLYQWTVEPVGQYLNQVRIFISLMILLGLMLVLVITTSLLFRKKMSHNEPDGNELMIKQMKNQNYFIPTPPNPQK